VRLVSYSNGADGWQAGALLDGALVAPLQRIAELAGLSPADRTATRSVRGALALGQAAREAMLGVDRSESAQDAIPLTSVRLGPPVIDPQKILCIGLNYRDHAAESGMELPTTPIVFAKFANSLVGPHDEIVLPPDDQMVDYEAELAVVIGPPARGVSPEDALGHVAGIMAFNDVSARDLQMATSQWTMGKAIDTFAPCGPALVTLDEIADVQDLAVQARINDETMQSGTTADMVFSVAEILAHLSRVMTLVPGDIIATGTPAGVGMGRTPPVYLAAGDTVEVELGAVGVLRNRVVSAT
jgi:2-keto-4-pentenoate hydratase/2-oxohepta-3-ene-1,7-dioic acid hydratase in catechol pathway